MKNKLAVIFTAIIMIALCCVGTPVSAASLIDKVDIGNPASEVGHALEGWGPIEPATHGGSWGGIAPGDCRVAYHSGEPDTGYGRSGIVTFETDEEISKIKMRVLDGIGDDSFAVYVSTYYQYNPWFGYWLGCYKIYEYEADPSTSEKWVKHRMDWDYFNNLPYSKVKIYVVSLGDEWAGFNTYGQLAVDWIKILRD